MYRLNNILLKYYYQINEEIKEEIKNYLKTNRNENTTYQNLQDTAKVVLRGKFIAIQTYLKKQEKSKQSNLTPKGARKRKTNKAQSKQKEGSNRDNIRHIQGGMAVDRRK